MTSQKAQYTDFSKDVLGRYVCNGLDEALHLRVQVSWVATRFSGEIGDARLPVRLQ